MLTFVNYLICEQHGGEVTSTLKAHIRRVIELLIQASKAPEQSFEDRVEKAGSELSELDLLEALDVMKTVIKNRFLEDGNLDNIGSIRAEVKEALRLNFSRTGQEGIGFLLSHFIKQVVNPILDILHKTPSGDVKAELDTIVSEASEHMKNITRRFHADDSTVARRLLTTHDKQLDIVRKKSTPVTKQDRLRIIKKVASGVKRKKQS